jgi:hypothetical protein
MKFIECNKPTQFLSQVLDKEILQKTLEGKLQNNQIPMVKNKFSKLYNEYSSFISKMTNKNNENVEKSFKILQNLNAISEGFN